jgi:hypothetical protein
MRWICCEFERGKVIESSGLEQTHGEVRQIFRKTSPVIAQQVLHETIADSLSTFTQTFVDFLRNFLSLSFDFPLTSYQNFISFLDT